MSFFSWPNWLWHMVLWPPISSGLFRHLEAPNRASHVIEGFSAREPFLFPSACAIHQAQEHHPSVALLCRAAPAIVFRNHPLGLC